MYTLACSLNFNAGTHQRFTCAACLYVVCRRNRSPHLLIDFSDVLQAPVKTIGRVYMKLMRRLVGGDFTNHLQAGSSGLEVPLVDPSIFIERFARRLELGGQQRKVQNTAMRLIQYMHRDWICIGRRPNGLVGAALLIASFYHGFQCSSKEIADVVRMSEDTLLLRLREMKETPMALMSKEQFEKANPETIEGETRALPPCLTRQRRKDAAPALPADSRQEPLEDGSAAKAIEDTAMPPPPVPSKKRKATESSPAEASSSSAAATDGKQPEDPQRASRYTKRNPTQVDVEEIAKEIASHHDIEPILDGRRDPAVEEKVEKLIAGRPNFAPPTEAEKKDGEGPPGTSSEDNVESLSDVDDEELESYLLDAEERQHKSDIWHEVNKDYLEEWHVRSLEIKRRKMRDHVNSERKAGKQAASASEGHADSASETNGSSLRKAPQGGTRRTSVSSCTQSALVGLAKKAKVKANRINLEALESLFS